MDILQRLSQFPHSIFLEIESLFRLNSRRVEKLILERRERPNLDFKERISWSGEYGGEFSKDVSAIANTGKRGYLIVGVKDPRANRGTPLDHLIAGIQPGEIRESELVKALRANCTPVPTIEYREIPCRGKLVGVVVIQPATTRPIQIARDCGYKQGVKKGQIFVRQGSGAFAITQVEAGEIVRKYRQRKWQQFFVTLLIASLLFNVYLFVESQ